MNSRRMSRHQENKRNQKKSADQIIALHEFYEQNINDWENCDLKALGEELNLERSKVYKFLWNLRKKDQKRSQEPSLSLSESEPARQAYENSSGIQSAYNKLTVNPEITIHVPKNLNFVREIFVPSKLTAWTENKLKENGWELVQLPKQ